jgi:hypothetical protein
LAGKKPVLAASVKRRPAIGADAGRRLAVAAAISAEKEAWQRSWNAIR